MIRTAVSTDSKLLADIYNQSIVGSNISNCDIYPVDQAIIASQIEDHGTRQRHPMFVYQKMDTIVGWSMIKPCSFRPDFSEIGELAIYMDNNYKHGVVAAKLFVHILDVAKRLGYNSVVAIILDQNEASKRGAMALGFNPIALLKEVAFRHGKWIDIRWYQKDLSRFGNEKITQRMQSSELK